MEDSIVNSVLLNILKHHLKTPYTSLVHSLCIIWKKQGIQSEADPPCAMCSDRTDFDRSLKPIVTPIFCPQRIQENYLRTNLVFSWEKIVIEL